ncbi:GNAT family N-acetyltransferase [Jeotgalibacillus haloalkalitolerans]|uniref:GNAT family N-acetyltransferase n=1 Tax=Jeotgalibacillus haloalkalitolerans TaxID=3104292 RepID=A0ABU5KII0_9BACL|nr:GNAT family N-acetyltransferase [Jeotgalibacillus sp. HH7-29]MDZ5711050.1 GNAT family N-acetyltransferase [Jeotgalibacillus sp. HH7-29]
MEILMIIFGTTISFVILFLVIRSAVTEGINRSVLGKGLIQDNTADTQKAQQHFSMMRGGRVITYQKATEASYNEILSLLKHCAGILKSEGIPQWSYLLSGGEDAEIRKDILAGNTYAVYEKDELIGTFTLRRGPDSWDEHIWKERIDQDGLYLHRLAVYPQIRKEGIGSACLSWIEENFEGEVLMLDCVEANGELNRFYQKRGFESAGTFDGHNRYWKRL